jgi:hypothetical protein
LANWGGGEEVRGGVGVEILGRLFFFPPYSHKILHFLSNTTW